MMMKSRVLAALALLLLLAGGTFAYFRYVQPRSLTESSPVPQQEETSAERVDSEKLRATYTYIATESGQIALDLLRAQTEVETENYGSAGEFVTSINGLAGNSEHYWAFYVNNKYAERGAGQTTLQEGDVIRFVYEAVQLTPPENDTSEEIQDIKPTEGSTNASSAGQTR